METQEEFSKAMLNAATEYANTHGIELATLGKKILNNAHFFDSVQDGKGYTVASYVKVTQWLRENMQDSKTLRSRSVAKPK